MVDSDRNLKIYERMLARGEKLDARAQFYYARELMTHQRFMPVSYTHLSPLVGVFCAKPDRVIRC